MQNTISIHAPARGATHVLLEDVIFTQISIHAPAKGATDNPAPSGLIIKISIHAPAKGATAKIGDYVIREPFQSTLPRRERPVSSTHFPLEEDFNPRSREGSDGIMEFEQFISDISIHAPAKGATLYNCQKEISI